MSAVLILLIVLGAIFIIWLFYPGKKENLEIPAVPADAKLPEEMKKEIIEDCKISCEKSDKPEDCIIACETLRKRKSFRASDD